MVEIDRPAKVTVVARRTLTGAPDNIIESTARMHGSLSVRMPGPFLDWLEDRAAEANSTVGEEIRNCVAAAIVSMGNASSYAIAVVDDVEDLEASR